MEGSIIVLPEKGLIPIGELAKVMDMTRDTLVQTLTDDNVPVIKLSTRKDHWMIRLEDLKPSEK